MHKTPMTIREFEAFLLLPGNEDCPFELIDGEVVEEPRRGTWYSALASVIVSPVFQFCKENNLPCHVSGAGGAYNILGNVIAPKFAYKHTPMSDDFPDPTPPEWAVQIIAPNDLAVTIRRKRQIYQEAGILYWEMYPKAQKIDVYAPGQPPRTVGIDGTLDGGDVLPGFTLAARALFGE